MDITTEALGNPQAIMRAQLGIIQEQAQRIKELEDALSLQSRAVTGYGKRISTLTAERDALKRENDHFAENYLIDKLDNIKAVSEFAACTDQEFKEAMEYGEECRCSVCEFTRYVLSLRAALTPSATEEGTEA